MNQTSQRTAIYCRISDDREGRGLGVERQEEDCRKLAANLGWDGLRVFTDNDISAFSRKHRPGYEAMLGAVRAGQVDGLIAWHNDRLHRHTRELEDFIDLVDTSGVLVQTVTAGVYDLTSSAGRMNARIVGVVARYESEHKSERLKAKHVQLLEQGAPTGGTRPFGLTDIIHERGETSRRDLVPEEAEALRQAARDIIAGTPIKAICRRWNQAGLTTTMGNSWQPIVVTRGLTSAWIVGRRSNGKQARWPAILDDDTQRKVKALLGSRAHGKVYGRTLLSGIATCGLCGHTLASRPKGDGRPCYICGTDLGGCGKIRILAEDFEADVLGRLFSALDDNQLHKTTSNEDPVTGAALTELTRLEGVKTGLAEMVGAGEMDLAEFRAAKTANDRLISNLSVTVAKGADMEAQRRTRAEALDLVDKWDDLDMDDKRRVVQALAEKVEVFPAVKGRNFYTPERVKVTPR